MFHSKDIIPIIVFLLFEISKCSSDTQESKNPWFDENSPAALISSDNYPSYILFDLNKINASLHSFTDDHFKLCNNIKTFNTTPSGFTSFQLTTMSNGLNGLIVDVLLDAHINSDLLIINSTNCQIHNETIYKSINPGGYGLKSMTSHNDIIDLFFIENGTSTCKRYNVTSRMWYAPVNFPNLATMEDVIDSVSYVTDGVYLIACGDFSNRTLISYNITSTKISSLSTMEGYYTSFISKYVSTANNAIGYCYSLNKSRIKCMKIDPNLKTLLNVEVSIDFEPLFIGVHNTRNGGLILIVGHTYGGKINLFDIRSNGSYEARGEVAQVDCLPFNEHFFTIFERSAGNVCVRFVCTRKVDSEVTKSVFVKCFKDLIPI
ncbi:hypothetical protein QAD02_006586 [Eretmocerus hayati]|uniref:Uncharacterized protein n=1 Tax=Eretmocerus hayati TaxID=131215 RepID=A0ACC2N3N3_9HYME|nr:hypothetical protein QAD02_006586 [Eretmocerus hayati]